MRIEKAVKLAVVGILKNDWAVKLVFWSERNIRDISPDSKSMLATMAALGKIVDTLQNIQSSAMQEKSIARQLKPYFSVTQLQFNSFNRHICAQLNYN
jgi:hypothetical protein